MSTKKKEQIGLDEKVIDMPELEKLLDERQELKPTLTQYLDTG